MRFYRRRKKDANHPEVVRALEHIGVRVIDLSAVGGGVPDILCSYRGINVLLEIKRPGVAGKKRGAVQNETNRKQSSFRENWLGPVAVVDGPLEAVSTMIGYGIGWEGR